MNIVFLIDDNYAEQLAVTLASLLINSNGGVEFNIFVFNTGLSEKNITRLKNINCGKKFNIEFFSVDDSIFDDLPRVSHLKKLNYVRLLFPSLIKCNRCLYLDCDLLVFKGLEEFYNTNFEDNYAVVVRDRWANSFQLENQMKKFGINNYFNAGVMLLNLEKMREDNIEGKSFDYIKTNASEIMFLEQCVLNKVFADKVKFVDKTYNFQYKLKHSEEAFDDFYSKNAYPHILHFVGYEKPFGGFAHPFENKYFEVLKKTPYRILYINFKMRMWKKLFEKLKKRIVIILKCMI